MILSCSESTEPDPTINCETVINAQGPGYLKVINRYSSKVYVFLPEYAFGAHVVADKCEIYGLATGTREAEISICVNNDCNNLSNTKYITFSIENGITHTIEITQGFFDN
jgi:hypothetical protein